MLIWSFKELHQILSFKSSSFLIYALLMVQKAGSVAYFEKAFFTTKGTTFKEQSATWSMVLRKPLINLCMNLTDEMQIKISLKLLVSTSNLQFFTALSRWVLHCFLLVTTSFINSVMRIFLQYFYQVLFTTNSVFYPAWKNDFL